MRSCPLGLDGLRLSHRFPDSHFICFPCGDPAQGRGSAPPPPMVAHEVAVTDLRQAFRLTKGVAETIDQTGIEPAHVLAGRPYQRFKVGPGLLKAKRMSPPELRQGHTIEDTKGFSTP